MRFQHVYCCKFILDRSSNIKEHPCHRFLPIDVDSEDIVVRVLTCSMIDDSSGYSVIGISDNLDKVREGHYSKEDGECDVIKVGAHRYMAIVTNRKCVLAKLINASRCLLVSAVPQTDTLIKWTIVGPSSEALHELRTTMRENGYKFETVASFSISSKVSLTSKEESAFNLAMDLGYYDVPRRIELDQISKIVDCSKSTMSVRLRGAEKKIFEFYRIFSMGDYLGNK